MEPKVEEQIRDKIPSRNNYNKSLKLHQCMESKKINYEMILTRINYGWMDNQQWQQESKKPRKSYFLLSSYVKPLTTSFQVEAFLRGVLYNDSNGDIQGDSGSNAYQNSGSAWLWAYMGNE